MSDLPADQPAPASPRLQAALASARSRRDRRDRRLQPTLWGIGAAIAIQALLTNPAPGTSGRGLAITVVLAALTLTMAAVASGLWVVLTEGRCTAFSLLVGGLGLALGLVQPGGMSILPPSVAILTAFLVIRPSRAAALSAVLLAGLLASQLAGRDGGWGTLIDQLLFCGVLAIAALSMRYASDNEERAELLLAQLEDAREAEAEAVALAERTRIAQDLHDVLAQTLSGLAVQVQAARRMARRDHATEDLQGLLDRAGQLVKDGLGDARRAVGALRGDRTLSLDRLAELVERYRTDLELDVTLSVTGQTRPLPAQTQLALYRGAQEALTNAVRYARTARTTVTLAYGPDATTLTVQDHRTADAPATAAPLAGGSGLGLEGMRERLAAIGGTAHAGPTATGWVVRMEVAA